MSVSEMVAVTTPVVTESSVLAVTIAIGPVTSTEVAVRMKVRSEGSTAFVRIRKSAAPPVRAATPVASTTPEVVLIASLIILS